MKNEIYLVPHTHYDAVWVFTREDYFHINIDLILKKVVILMEKEKDYRFLIEQTYLLEEIKNKYPELFRKIKKYIQEDKIEIADGEYLMADTMFPQGETLVREIAVGKDFVEENFNKDVEVMWQADSFGLNNQLPQVYRKCGYKYVAFRRGAFQRKFSEFIWQGLDGTKIISHFMPLGYRAGLDLTKLEESYTKLKGWAATKNILMPSGSGVTLPQEETMSAVKKWNRKHKSKMKIALVSEFFRSLEKEQKKLRVRKGEMYSGRYSRVFPGTASTRIWLKKDLRECENSLIGFEKFSSINSLLGNKCPINLRNLWKKVLFLAFHDVVPGTGVDSGYTEAKENISFLKSRIPDPFNYVLNSILINNSKIGGGSTSPNFEEIAVFNSLSWDVSDWVECELDFKQGKVFKITGVKNQNIEKEVEEIESQRYSDNSLKRIKIGFVADVPALGYKVYRIMSAKPQIDESFFLKQNNNLIKNKFFNVKFSKEDGLIEVFQRNKLLCKGNEIVLDDESGDLYNHKESFNFPLKTESGKGLKYGTFKIRNYNTQDSNLRKIINIETDYFSLRWPYRLVDSLKPQIWRYPFIKFRKKMIIYKELPRIDFVTEVENNHPKIRIRVGFDTKVNQDKYVSESQFGTTERKTDQYHLKCASYYEECPGIFPCWQWFDYSDQRKGLTLINTGNPENEVRDNCMYLTLLRSVEVLSSDGKAGPIIPVSEAREFRNYVFNYSIYPHQNDWKKAKVWKQAWQVNNKLAALQVEPDRKCRAENSFLKVEPDNVLLSAFKKAEKNNGFIVRVYEISGKKTRARINSFKDIKDVQTVNLLEKEDKKISKKIKLNKNIMEFTINPFEIVTLKIKL